MTFQGGQTGGHGRHLCESSITLKSEHYQNPLGNLFVSRGLYLYKNELYTGERTVLRIYGKPKKFHIKSQSITFNGSVIEHESESFKGTRYSLVFFNALAEHSK